MSVQEEQLKAEFDILFDTLMKYEDRMKELERNVEYWQNDSAAAWDQCEERRLENCALRKVVDAATVYVNSSGVQSQIFYDDLKDRVRELDELKK